MPAVTVDNPLTLPRIPEPDRAVAVERPVVSVTSAPSGFEGEGFPVRRAFAGVDLALLDPFIHMDQMGEVEYAPGERQQHSKRQQHRTQPGIVDGASNVLVGGLV